MMLLFGNVLLPAGLDDIGGVILLLLFVASLVTVLTWLVQYSVGIWQRRASLKLKPAPLKEVGIWKALTRLGFGRGSSSSESGLKGLFASFAFRSFRENWQKAWIQALNEQACRIGSSVQITFEESAHLPSSVHIDHMTCADQSEFSMVLQCNLSVDEVQFPVTVTQQSPAAVSMDTYLVTLAVLNAKLEIYMEEVQDEGLLVSWTFKERPNLSLKVTPKLQQRENNGRVAASTVKDLIEDTIVSTQPAMMVNLKACTTSNMVSSDRLSKGSGTPASMGSPVTSSLVIRRLKALNVVRAEKGGGGELLCALELDNPRQQKQTRLLPLYLNVPAELSWDDEISFELGPSSQELRLKVLETASNGTRVVLGQTTVPLNYFQRQPCGRQIRSLTAGGRLSSTTVEAVSLELVYPESLEGNSSHPAVPGRAVITPTKKVETDRTIMPDGTIVTTVTTIQSRPKTDCKLDSPSRSPSKVEVTEKKLVVLADSNSTGVTPTADSHLSNGLDPVAETAIRQLTDSTNRPAKKTPTKRSTLIISAVSKVPVGQDEMSHAIGYAAAMDDSLKVDSTASGALSNSQSLAESPRSTESSVRGQRVSQDLDDTTRSDTSERPSVDDVDSETGSTGALETRSLKDHKVGFLRSGTKLLFRKKHKQKDPGLSQSHDDLSNVSNGTTSRKKSGSFSRRLIKRFSFKSKSKPKANGSATGGEN
ncbi:phospholipid transfer protein C2CD2L isoform X2 [Protopterus annectens]|uniref:phospholipid transfer protein C2CD2L isoform X2 n=1 Tax=Protopterus annectens TaxID=7888 RepID=UPI001CFAE27F|nr:phospholipid transfer protein C2CD2L isoform X2 [Protopterus annectens]